MITQEDLKNLGWRSGPMFGRAVKLAQLMHERGIDRAEFLRALESGDFARVRPVGSEEEALATEIVEWIRETAPVAPKPEGSVGLSDPCPMRIWGEQGIDEQALDQMRTVCRVPSAYRGALMPDAHVGYTMPIGGVLATQDTVIPSAVGVDIACRMRLTITEIPFGRFEGWRDKLRHALVDETRFGVGADFARGDRRQHDVLDDPRWEELPRSLRALKDKAHEQLGSSGGGNHFVEWGAFTFEDRASAEKAGAGRTEPGTPYLALLSHSGSRGLGAQTADHFIKLAEETCGLPHELRKLAWLSLASEAGRMYWDAMQLAGRYAAANHEMIHRTVLDAAGLRRDVAAEVENHHNFAWKEQYGGREVVVHRKGATPAGRGVLGIIPGSMADPGFLVEGLGSEEALDSAAHGAGRKLSRSQAYKTVDRSDWKKMLEERGVELLSAGVDESPQVYKDIREVMELQRDLVRVLGRFDPKMVRMAADEGRRGRRKRKKHRQ